jgi:hypothetical protein
MEDKMAKSMEGKMAKTLFTLSFSLLGLTFLYGYRVITKGQQTSESITAIDGKSAAEKDVKNGKRFADYKTGQKLTDSAFLDQRSNDIVVTKAPSIIDVAIQRPCPEYPNPGFVGLAYAADAIVIGEIKGKVASQLTEDEEFLFSEYDVVVEDVIKDNANASIILNSVINVIRPGGKVKVNEKVITAVVYSFKPFLEGDQYLLFLKYIPETQSYQAFTNGSFLIAGDVIKTPKAGIRERLKQSFLTEVRDAVRGEPCLIEVLN